MKKLNHDKFEFLEYEDIGFKGHLGYSELKQRTLLERIFSFIKKVFNG